MEPPASPQQPSSHPDPRPDSQPGSPSRRVPGSVLVVLAALAVEAALLLAVCAVFGYALVSGRSVDERLDIATAVFCLLVVGVLLACGRALWRGQRWARAPVVTLQLLTLLALAVPALQGRRWWVGALLVAISMVAGAGLFTPSAVEHTDGRANPPIA